MIGVSALAVFVVNSVAGYAIKRGLDNLLKDRKTFEKRLGKVIDETINEYDKLFIVKEKNKFPFYKSQVFIDELLTYRFFHKDGYEINASRLQEELNKNPRIITPSTDQIDKFYSLFVSRVDSDEYLSSLEIKEFYKEEIFVISAEVSKLTRLLSEYQEGMISLLVGEYQRELNESLADIELFKPNSAIRKIETLEAELLKNNKFVSEPLKARFYFIKALCLAELHQSEEAHKLFIKAYKHEIGNSIYRQRACYSYFFLKDLTWSILCDEILKTEDYDPYAWAAKSLNSVDSEMISYIRKNVPIPVRNNPLFRRLIFNYCFNYSSQLITDLIEEFPFNETQKTQPDSITYQNLQYWILICNISNPLTFRGINIPFTGKINHDERLEYWINLSDQILALIKNTEVEEHFIPMSFLNLWMRSEINGKEVQLDQLRTAYNALQKKDIFNSFLFANSLQKNDLLDEALSTTLSIPDVYDINLLSLRAFCYYRKQDGDNFVKTVKEYLVGLESLDETNIYATLNLLHLLRGMHNRIDEFLELVESLSAVNEVYRSVCSLSIKSLRPESEKKLVNEEIEVIKKELLNDQIISFFIAQIYFNIEEYKSCINTLKLYLEESVPSRDLLLYIHALDKLKSEDQLELLRVLKNWRSNNFPFIEDFVRLELELNQLIGNWIEIESIANYALKVQPNNEAFIMMNVIALNINEKPEEIAKVLPTIVELKFTNSDFALRVVNVLLHRQYFQESLDLIYSQANDSTNLLARVNYIHFTSQIPEGYLKEFDEVEVGTYLKYSINDIVEIVQINEKNIKESDLYKKAIGRKKGDSFTLSSSISRKESTIHIIRIMDKYLSLFEEILKQAENPHSGLGLEMASFEGYSKENIDKFLIDMLGVSGEETKNLKEQYLLEYASGKFSLSQLARTNFDFDFLTCFYYLTESQKANYNIAPMQYYPSDLHLNDKIVIDIPTGILFYELSKQIPLAFDKFIVPPSLISEINHQLQKAKSEVNTRMSVSVEAAKITPYFYSNEFHQNRIAHFTSLLQWFNDNTIQEQPIEKIDLIRPLMENEKVEPSFNYLIDLLVLSRRKNYFLLTDDSFFFQLIPPVSGETISSEYYLRESFPTALDEIYSFLLQKRFKGLTLNRRVLQKAYSSQSNPSKSNIWPQALENLSLKHNFDPLVIIESVKFLQELSLASTISPEKYQFDAINVFTAILLSVPDQAGFYFLRDKIYETFKLIPQQLNSTIEALILALKKLNSGNEVQE